MTQTSMIDAMKQALEALAMFEVGETVAETQFWYANLISPEIVDTTMTNLRTAIEQAEKVEPVAWQHIANEWADELCNAKVSLQNACDGITPVEDAIAAIQRGIDRCRLLTHPAPAVPDPTPVYQVWEDDGERHYWMDCSEWEYNQTPNQDRRLLHLVSEPK